MNRVKFFLCNIWKMLTEYAHLLGSSEYSSINSQKFRFFLCIVKVSMLCFTHLAYIALQLTVHRWLCECWRKFYYVLTYSRRKSSPIHNNFIIILDKNDKKAQASESMDQSMNNIETTQIQPPKLTKIKIENMNGDQVSYKVTLLFKQENDEKTEVRRFVVPQDCSTSMVYLKEKLR